MQWLQASDRWKTPGLEPFWLHEAAHPTEERTLREVDRLSLHTIMQLWHPEHKLWLK